MKKEEKEGLERKERIEDLFNKFLMISGLDFEKKTYGDEEMYWSEYIFFDKKIKFLVNDTGYCTFELKNKSKEVRR